MSQAIEMVHARVCTRQCETVLRREQEGGLTNVAHPRLRTAGAITGIAILDVGRHIADELLQMTGALNDILSRSVLLAAALL